jgi:hypothetical protein
MHLRAVYVRMQVFFFSCKKHGLYVLQKQYPIFVNLLYFTF